MTADPVSITAAAGLAVVAAVIVAEVAARFTQATLRAIGGHHIDAPFVDRTRRVIRVVTFLVAAAALILPALTFVGVQHITAGKNPEALAKWTRFLGDVFDLWFSAPPAHSPK